ncbi:MAG: hypothetical protein IKA17_01150 [Clostridia bacterium]|nr:hypothetical protein [Clostridia bacterium]
MLKKENRYDFKKELLQIHKKNVRDHSLVPNENEFVIADNFYITVPRDADDVILTAVRDFNDYLWTSMNVSSSPSYTASENCIKISLNQDIEDASGYMGYRITFYDNYITLEGYDNVGVAQGLYFLEDLMNLRKAPYLKKKTIKSKAIYEYRAAQSPLGMFEFTDECLAMMAHRGYNIISLWIKDVNLTNRDDYIDMPLLCERAEKYGIGIMIMLYKNHSAHPDDEGAEEFYDNMYGKIFEACPKIRGVSLIGEANHFSSRDPRAGKAPHSANVIDNIPTGKMSPGFFPCSDYPEWVRLIQKCIRKHNKDAIITFSSYNWGLAPKEARVELIKNLPEDIYLALGWEMYEKFKVGDATIGVADYTLRIPGPSEYFKSEAEIAKQRGMKVLATVNSAGRTWDFGVIPYEPMPHQWIKRFRSMLDARENYNLYGLNECIHYGFHPSFVNDLEKWATFTHEEGLEEILEALLIRDFEEKNYSEVNRALEIWSEAIQHIPPAYELQYGALRVGPAYPLWLRADGGGNKKPDDAGAMFGHSGMYTGSYSTGFFDEYDSPGRRVHVNLQGIKETGALLLEGLNVLEEIKEPNDNLLRLINLGKFMYRTCITAEHVIRIYLLVQKSLVTYDKEARLAYAKEMREILLAEKDNVEKTIPIVQLDSRLGWEPSMEYQCDEKCLRWKLRQLEHELNISLWRIDETNKY